MDLFRTTRLNVIGSAVVFDGDGFSAALVRSVVGGVSLFAPRSMKTRVLPAVPEAAHWLHGQLSILADAPPPIDLIIRTAERLEAPGASVVPPRT